MMESKIAPEYAGLCEHGNFPRTCQRCLESISERTGQSSQEQERKEQAEVLDGEYEKYAREFYVAYRGLVDYLSGGVETLPNHEFSNEEDRRRWEMFTQGIAEGLSHQQGLLESQGTNKETLLVDVLSKLNISFTSHELDRIQIENQGRVPIVFISDDLYHEKKVFKGTKALAFTPREGISMIIIPQSSDLEHNEYIARENIPHETHHVGWKWAMRSRAIPNNELGDFRKASFSMYQDELMARTVSAGALSGYTHLHMLSPEAATQSKLDNQDDHADVEEIVMHLNDIARDIQRELQERETEITGADIGLSVFRATNFEELRIAFEQIKVHLATLPRKPLAGAGDWGGTSVY